jgi:leader peptidase (prepilin peptidase) / N-methyltransferase
VELAAADDVVMGGGKGMPANGGGPDAGAAGREPTMAPPPADAGNSAKAEVSDAAPVADAQTPADQQAELWIQYPHARREMVKELAFLAPAAALGFGGWHLARLIGDVHTGPWNQEVAGVALPLWLSVLGGVLIGYLVGGGIVWGVRILGSLGFGKEAMGLGDVHLMAAVGACLGWVDATLAFFGAAFVGIAWWPLGRMFSGVFPRAMPYGPFLAIATILVLLMKPAIETGLALLTGAPVRLP